MVEPISIKVDCTSPSDAGALATGRTRSNVTALVASPARLRPSLKRQSLALTSAIICCLAPSASTAMCCTSRANGTANARPLSLPSASMVMRSCGRTGASVIGVAGALMPACVRSQPAASVSASGTDNAKRPATARIAKPSARPAPEPPNSSGTQASGRPASLSARHSGSFHAPLAALLMVCGSARSARIRAAALATICSLSSGTIY